MAPPPFEITRRSYGIRTPICENTGGIDLATYEEARGVSIHEYTLVSLRCGERIL